MQQPAQAFPADGTSPAPLSSSLPPSSVAPPTEDVEMESGSSGLADVGETLELSGTLQSAGGGTGTPLPGDVAAVLPGGRLTLDTKHQETLYCTVVHHSPSDSSSPLLSGAAATETISASLNCLSMASDVSQAEAGAKAAQVADQTLVKVFLSAGQVVAAGDLILPSGRCDGSGRVLALSSLTNATAFFQDSPVQMGAVAIALSAMNPRTATGRVTALGEPGCHLAYVQAVRRNPVASIVEAALAKQVVQLKAERAKAAATIGRLNANVSELTTELSKQRQKAATPPSPFFLSPASALSPRLSVPERPQSAPPATSEAEGMQEACGYCKQSDHQEDECPSAVLIDLRKSAEVKLPGRVRSPLARSSSDVGRPKGKAKAAKGKTGLPTPLRIGSKRTMSESGADFGSARLGLTQSSPALSLGYRRMSGGGTALPTSATCMGMASVKCSPSLRTSSSFANLSDSAVDTVSHLIGVPAVAPIRCSYPPQRKDLEPLLRRQAPALYIMSLCKSGRHSQEEIASVLGCNGPNPIFKKFKLVFLYVPEASAPLDYAPTVEVTIKRLCPEHPSTLDFETGVGTLSSCQQARVVRHPDAGAASGNGAAAASSAFSTAYGSNGASGCFGVLPDASGLPSTMATAFEVTLKPDHPRKVGGQSAMFDIELAVDGSRVLTWNVQIYNSRYGPRLVNERPERTPYSRPPAVYALHRQGGSWAPSVAFLEDDGTTSAPPLKVRKIRSSGGGSTPTPIPVPRAMDGQEVLPSQPQEFFGSGIRPLAARTFPTLGGPVPPSGPPSPAVGRSRLFAQQQVGGSGGTGQQQQGGQNVLRTSGMDYPKMPCLSGNSLTSSSEATPVHRPAEFLRTMQLSVKSERETSQ